MSGRLQSALVAAVVATTHVVGPVWLGEPPTPSDPSTSEACERTTDHGSREATYSVGIAPSAPCALLRQGGSNTVAAAVRCESFTRPARDLVAANEPRGTHVRDGREVLRAARGLRLPRCSLLGEPDD